MVENLTSFFSLENKDISFHIMKGVFLRKIETKQSPPLWMKLWLELSTDDQYLGSVWNWRTKSVWYQNDPRKGSGRNAFLW